MKVVGTVRPGSRGSLLVEIDLEELRRLLGLRWDQGIVTEPGTLIDLTEAIEIAKHLATNGNVLASAADRLEKMADQLRHFTDPRELFLEPDPPAETATKD